MTHTKRAVWIRSLALVTLLALSPQVIAITFDLSDDINGVLNTSITAGAGMRMKDRNVNAIGKANLNPDLCGGREQSCQGVFRDQTHPARTLSLATGAASVNADDGDLNYDRGDLTQAVMKVTQDLKITWGQYGFFAKWLYFYDFVNNHFTEFHPNMITATNRSSVGCTTPVSSGGCNASSFSRAYGPGAPTYRPRTDPETLRQLGTDLQLFDLYIYGQAKLPFTEDHNVSFKLGRQNVNWGESTVFLINSLNQVNPVNVNNLTRVGFDLAELSTPTGMLFASTEILGTTLETFYGYEWKPVEIPAPGGFFSFADLGTNNAMRYASISFGGPAEDPDFCTTGAPGAGNYYNPESGCGSPQNSPLSSITPTSLTIRRLADREPHGSGQFGLALKYYADWLGNGTQLSLYAMNYHSKLPYVSFYAADRSCAKSATNLLALAAACPDMPIANSGNPSAATSNAVPLDTPRYVVEYPEDIHLFGASFNTTLGDFSLQGEVSYRPNLPVQIDLQDLTFAALQPTLAGCGTPSSACTGASSGSSSVDGQAYANNNFMPYPGTGITSFQDTFSVGVGVLDGSSRSFPSFIAAYRGIAAGDVAPNSYIRGYERYGVWQTDLGATYVQGATDNVIGADQILYVAEWGVQYVPSLPKPNVLQVETPGTNYHASAGADGSMTGNYQQDCANTIDCNYSGYNPATGQTFGTNCTAVPSRNTTGCGDGLRFNPHQQPADTFANWHNYSTGIAIVNIIRYESVFPGVSFAPTTIFQWGVKGTSVDVANQFVENKKQIIFNWETRYKESLAFYVGHIWFTGAGDANPLSDRNELFTYVKYQF